MATIRLYWPDAAENMGWLEISSIPVSHEGVEGDLDKLLIEHVKEHYGI